MIDIEVVRQQLNVERRTLAQDGRALEILPYVSRTASYTGSRHMITFSSLSSAMADTVIAEQIAHYRDIGAQLEWKAYAYDNPSDLLERLERHGFSIGQRETVLALDLEDRPSWMDEPRQKIMRVESASQAGLFRHIAEEVFKKSYEFTANELLAAIRNGSTQHLAYIAMDCEIGVSIGRLYTQPRSVFGGLYGGGTLERYRGRGFYRATVAARARDAVKAGARYLIVDALPTSRPILEQLGFIRITDTWPCIRK